MFFFFFAGYILKITQLLKYYVPMLTPYSAFFERYFFLHLPSSPLAFHDATACVTAPLGQLCTAAYSSSVTDLLYHKGCKHHLLCFTVSKQARRKDPWSRWSKGEAAAFWRQSQGVCTKINQCQHAILSQKARE